MSTRTRSGSEIRTERTLCIPSRVYRTMLLVYADCLNSPVDSVSLDGVARTENSQRMFIVPPR
jgi:hypothetical protein